MDEVAIDRIFENLFHVLALLHKKMLRMDLGGVTDDLTRLHFGIMGVLSQGSLATSELAKVLSIQKPQITHLVEHLVNLDIVERHPDAEDRRVIHLALTHHGRILLEDTNKKVRQKIKGELAVLTPDELRAMSDALETLKSIGTKL